MTEEAGSDLAHFRFISDDVSDLDSALTPVPDPTQ